MNPLNRQWFYRRFHKTLREALPKDQADQIWDDAGQEYARILSRHPGIRRRKGGMVLPSVALYRALNRHGQHAEEMLNCYGEQMGKRFPGSFMS